MNRFTPALRYALIGAIVLILAALVFWYFLLQNKNETITTEDASRGAGLEPPTFGSVVGSTYENLVGSLSTLMGDRDADTSGSLPRLVQVSSAPSAGAAFIRTATSTRLRFVERSSGYVLDSSVEEKGLTRRTNTLVPRVYEALILPSDRMLLRSIGDDGGIVTSAMRIATSSASEGSPLVLQGELPRDISAITASPAGDEVFYLLPGALGVRAAWDGTKAQPIFSSTISGWQVQWTSPERILIVQNASDSATSYAYELGKDGSLSPIVRNDTGLQVLSHPSSRSLLYSYSAGGALSLFAQMSGTSSPASLPVRTIADKCVWDPGQRLMIYCAVPQISPPENFLDRWYRGEVHTTDTWWKIDVSAASAELLHAPSGVELDVERPVIDPAGDYIAFLNARDKSLWLLRIEE